MSFKLKLSALCAAAASVGIFSIPANATESLNFGSIAFVGDSITQGGGTADELSYRYSLWKIFVSNDVAWNPVGSMTTFNNGLGASSTLTPDFRGKKFDNTNEGHYGWRTYDFLKGPENRTPSSGSGKLEEWLNDETSYPSAPDTVTLLLGVNDLSYNKTFEETASNAKQIVQTYQNANENVKSYVFSILPTNQTQAFSAKIKDYNEYIKGEIEAGEWGKNVVYCDVTSGFDAAAFTLNDNVHPNAAGALHVAKNMAKALGLNPNIYLGIEQKKSSELASQTSFAASGNSIAASVKTGENKKDFTGPTTTTNSLWTVDSGHLKIDTTANKSEASDIRMANWITGNDAQDFTFEISVQMGKTNSADNFLGLFLGNGENVGLLYIGESGIFWNGTSAKNLLYGGYSDGYKTELTTLNYVDLRVAYISGEEGVAEGYYVWFGDELIGDCLQGTTTVNAYKNTLLIGDIGNQYTVNADIKNISFEVGKAYSAIPEPSAFGLLAGLGALALVSARRRRK